MSSATRTWRVARWPVTVQVWLALGFAAGLGLAATVPNLLGYRTLTVLSGSMSPTLETGDLVLSKQIPVSEARVGDVITFHDPSTKRLVTHRLRKMSAGKSRVAMTTKGDANNTTERWEISLGGRLGRAELRIPRLGYVMAYAGSRLGRLVLIAFPVLLLGAWELIRIWRPSGD